MDIMVGFVRPTEVKICIIHRDKSATGGADSHAEGSPGLLGWLAWESRQTKEMHGME